MPKRRENQSFSEWILELLEYWERSEPESEMERRTR